MLKYIILFLTGFIFLSQFFGPDLGVFILYFLVIDPVLSILLGIWSGTDVGHRWYFVPVFCALYLILAWIFLALWENAFVIYAFEYLALGLASMGITAFVKNIVKRKNGSDR